MSRSFFIDMHAAHSTFLPQLKAVDVPSYLRALTAKCMRIGKRQGTRLLMTSTVSLGAGLPVVLQKVKRVRSPALAPRQMNRLPIRIVTSIAIVLLWCPDECRSNRRLLRMPYTCLPLCVFLTHHACVFSRTPSSCSRA